MWIELTVSKLDWKIPCIPPKENTRKRIITFNLHTMRAAELRRFLPSIIQKNVGKVSEIHFITGKGNHSPDNVPVLKPMVLKFAEKNNLKAEVHPQNIGVIIVYIPNELHQVLSF